MTNRLSTFLKRDFIKKDEGKLTYVQLFGFILMIVGILYYVSFLLPIGIKDVLHISKISEAESSEVPIAFFTIMLGTALLFPNLLKSQDQKISTLRIIVFMFTNVICMLLLKMGWDKHSLSEIGLNEYWIVVIAFLFAAKVTQSYFENIGKLNKPTPELTTYNSSSKQENWGISEIAIAQIAEASYKTKLKAKFSNIIEVSATLTNDGKRCIAIYLKDNITKDIPSSLKAELNETKIIDVPTELISNTGIAKVHIAQLTNNIEDSRTRDYPGSICCAVDSLNYPNFRGIVTAGHIFTHGKNINYNQYVQPNEIRDTYSNNSFIGKLYYQEISDAIDIAIVELRTGSQLSEECMSFMNSFYECTYKDLYADKENITVLSRNNNSRNGFILDFNLTLPMYYDIEGKYVSNLILIGSAPNKNDSKTLSSAGDSGSCVFHIKTKQLIGILIGGDKNFSFVLPIEEVIKSNNLKIK